MLDMKKRIRVPIFKGELGANPETHILRTVDWFKELKIGTDGDKVKNFKLTLDGDARQWLDDITPPATWDDLRTQFKKRFSTQGRLLRHLHEKWHSFSFDPSSDDIETFIRDVKVTANHLGHGNVSILNLIKACIPTKCYGSLYSITDLADLIKMVKNIYSMKPDTSKTTAMTSTTSFSTKQSKIARQPSFNLASASFPGLPNDHFYRYYDNNMLNNRRSRPNNHTLPEAEVGVDMSIIIKASSIQVIMDIKVEIDFIQKEAISDPRGGRRPFQKFDRGQNVRRSKHSSKVVNTDKAGRCFQCH